MRFAFYALLLPLAFAAPQFATAQTKEFPNRPIRLIIPFPPGGSNDVLGRYFGMRLTDRIGQNVVVDNRAGANGIIGAELTAKAPPDGHTLLIVSLSWVLNQAVRPLSYDVQKSFAPVAMFGAAPNSIVVHPGAGFGSLRDLVARAKAKPGSISYASTGVAGFNHFGGELFKRIAGIEMVHVPYKGGGPAMIDVMAGQMPVMFTSVTQVLPHIRTGKIQMLAVGGRERSPAVPNVPTVAEAGFPGYEAYVWWGVVAAAGVPEPILSTLSDAFNAILKDPATQKMMEIEAAVVNIMTRAEFSKVIAEDLVSWTRIAKEAGISVR